MTSMDNAEIVLSKRDLPVPQSVVLSQNFPID